MQKVAIYAGKGTSSNGIDRLLFALQGKYATQLVDASFFLQAHELNAISLIIFPGGRDLFYHEELKGKANGAIRSFVETGGSYLGICAGGYYGAAEIEFEKEGPLEVVGERELKFFPGKAIGPAYGKGCFQYDSEAGARSALISWEKGNETPIYFNGGCYFENPGSYSHIKVIGVYKEVLDRPAAIVECQIGSGKALLSGVHIEYSPPLLSHFLSLIIS